MKKFFSILIVMCGLLLLSSCIYCSRGKGDKEKTVLKQVRVAVQTANLRTGPGTSYGYATVNPDGTGGKWQVKRGTLLDVVAKEKGWYQVRVAEDSRTVYIKQSLCADLTQGGKGTRKEKKESVEDVSESKPDENPENAQSSPSPSADGVVEEAVSESSQDDEVIF